MQNGLFPCFLVAAKEKHKTEEVFWVSSKKNSGQCAKKEIMESLGGKKPLSLSNTFTLISTFKEIWQQQWWAEGNYEVIRGQKVTFTF